MKPFINYYPQLKQSIKKFKLFIYQGMKNAMQTLNHSITQYIVFLKKWLYPFLSFILFIRLGPNLLQCRNMRYQTCVSKQYNQYSAENKSGKNILRYKNATQMFISFARFVYSAITIQVFQEACTENHYKTIKYNLCMHATLHNGCSIWMKTLIDICFFLFSDIIIKSVRMSSTYFVDRLIEKFIKNSSFEHTSDR